jgi:hypothetical protein
MSLVSGIVGATQMLVQSPVVKASEGSPMEEAHESPAKKAREQQATVQAAAPPAPSAPGVGGTINVLA